MVAIAIFSADPVLPRSLEQLLREDPTLTVVGVTDDPSAVLRLIDQDHVDAVLACATARAVRRLANPAQPNSLHDPC
jgi:DNA-binding NarL/FixJ family response regulator